MIRNAIFFLVITVCLPAPILMAQDRCGTVEYMDKLRQQNQFPKSDVLFENWLAKKIQDRRQSRSQRTQAPPYQIPVVVHVIHNDEPPGTGTNISDEQIMSQLRVLNEDFQRLNADAAQTPGEFLSVAGSMDIEFVLAKQNPEGLATTGIVRVKGSQSSWTMQDNYTLKSLSYWPAGDYLNIWVCNLTDLLGYAQLPESTLVPGLEESSNNALTDGVVIWYRAFGSQEDGPFNLSPDFDKGRTATHEVGHFFGLRHIWGDDSGSCTEGTDYVDDTPNQGGSSSGCPGHPRKTCGINSMFQNFLDYTDDECMNLFTQGQVTRMSTVLENSPRRASLLTSPGLEDPVPVPNDLGVRQVIAPGSKHCENTITPAVEVRNYGSNAVTSARITFSINGSNIETKDVALSLSPLESDVVVFGDAVVSAGLNTATFAITLTNGGPDGNSGNNIQTAGFFVPEPADVPFAENFEAPLSGWVIENPDAQTGWEITNAAKESVNNQALSLDFFNYRDAFGEVDILFSPVFDLTNVNVASMIFDVAYATYQNSADGLKVVVMKSCESLAEGTIVYEKEGAALATAAPTSNSFVPQGPGDWRKEFIILDDFIGQENVQLAFVGVNDWGNNLYIDNLSLIISRFEDLALVDVLSPSLVTCDPTPTPRILVQNSGNVVIENFDVEYSVNDGPWQVFPVDGLSFNPGTEMEIHLPAFNLSAGINHLGINLENPNAATDSIPGNDSLRVITVVNTETKRIPFRESFGIYDFAWTAANPEEGMNWEPVLTNFGASFYFNGYDNATIGDEAWLVSPTLDFSGALEASMVFDLSQKKRSGRKELLQILVSRDCGNTYSPINTVFAEPGDFSDAWSPDSQEDWTGNIIINLNEFAGDRFVRVAFVVTNQHGNNVFIDNVEFFTSNNPSLLAVENPFSVYGYSLSDPSQSSLKVTFNLSERSDVLFSVVDIVGKSYGEVMLRDVLNQTYLLEDAASLSPGLYIVRMKIGNEYFSEKVLISQ